MKVIFKGKTIEHVGYLNANYDEFEPETLQERIGTINVFLSEVNFDPEFIQLFTTQSEMELDEPEDLTIISSGTPVGEHDLNTGKFYCGTDSKTGEAYANWRIYQSESAKVKFESTTKTIKTIKITFEAQKTGTLLLNDTVIESDAVTEINASTAEFTVGNSGTSTKGQIKISAIEVVLE